MSLLSESRFRWRKSCGRQRQPHKLSPFDGAANDPLVTRRQALTIQEIPKTVGTPQAQFIPVVMKDWCLLFRRHREPWRPHWFRTFDRTADVLVVMQRRVLVIQPCRTPCGSHRPSTLRRSSTSKL